MAVPVITTVTPATGTVTGGTSLAIVGTGFTGTTGVTVGGTAATSFTVVDDTHLTVVTPAHAGGAATIVVTNATGPSVTGAGKFAYGAPSITSVAPMKVGLSGGSKIAVFGAGLTGLTAATVGGVAATKIAVIKDTEAVITVPTASAGAADLVVTNAFGSATSVGAVTYAASYTAPVGTSGHKYFQDCEMSGITVKDGTLRERLNTKRFPKLGTLA